MRLTPKRLCHLLVPWMLACGPACQGTSPPVTQAGSPTEAPVSSPSQTSQAAPTVTAAATVIGPAGLTGHVLAASDVSGQPEAPLPDQLVLAVPVDQADDVLGPGTTGLDETGLRFLKSDLPAPHPALAAAVTDAAGRYSLVLAPGEYVLCVADAEATPPIFPARTRGCGRATVPPGALGQVDLSSGFGEILLIPR